MILQVRRTQDESMVGHRGNAYLNSLRQPILFFFRKSCKIRFVEHSPAILIRRRAWSDTSWIVTWLTLQHGKIATVARGARRPSSPFAGKLDLFFAVEISYAVSRKSALHSLREVAVRQPFDASPVPGANLFLCSYFAELTELVTEPGEPLPELFDLLSRAFVHLGSAPATRRALEHFEKELARILGIHEADTPPLASLQAHCGKIPSSRATVLKQIERDPKFPLVCREENP